MRKLSLIIIAALTVLIALPGCTTLKSKAFGLASNGTVIKIESTGSTTSGTIAPNLLLGTVQNSLASAPALEDGMKTQVVVAYTEAHSSLAAVFGHAAVTRTFTYIGNPAESAEETAARLNAVAAVLNSDAKSAPTTSTSTTDSAASTTTTAGAAKED